MRGDDRTEFGCDGLVIEGGVFFYHGGSDIDAEVVILSGADDAMGTHNNYHSITRTKDMTKNQIIFDRF